MLHSRKRKIISSVITGIVFSVIALFILTYSLYTLSLDFPRMEIETYTFEDMSSDLTIDSVSSKESAKHFSPNPNSKVFYNITSSSIWIKFRPRNPTSKNIYCQLSNPNLQHVEYYAPVGDNRFMVIKTGFLEKFNTRHIAFDRFTFAVEREQDWHYLRLKSSHFLSTTLVVSDRIDEMDRDFTYRIFLYGVYVCLVMVVAAYSIVLMIINTKLTYLLFFTYVIAIASINLVEKGILFQFAWPNHPELNLLFPLLPVIANFAFIGFVYKLLNFRKVIKPWVLRLGLLHSLVLSICTVIFMAISNYQVAVVVAEVYSISVIVIVLLALVIKYNSIWQPRLNLSILLFGQVSIMLSVLMYLLSENSIISPNAIIENGITISSVIDIVCFTAVMTLNHLSGRQRMLSIVRNQNDTLQAMVASRTAELVKKNADLDNLIHEKDSLIGIVAHDLRSPLNQAKGLCHLLEIELVNRSEAANSLLQMIGAASDRGLNLIKQLLMVSSLEHDRSQLEFEQVDVARTMKEIIETFKASANAKRIDITLSCDVKKPIRTSKEYLIRITENLLSNAVKYSRSMSVIHVTATDCQSEIAISVADAGPGFTEDDKTKLFKKFQRLSARPTGNESSNGLGLYIIKLLADKLGASITLDTEPGKGSTFTLRLKKSGA